jgi:oligoendopeptidase F
MIADCLRWARRSAMPSFPLAALLACLLAMTSTVAQTAPPAPPAPPSPAAVADADRWDLTEIYPDLAARNADAARVEHALDELGSCRGHLADDAAALRRCLDLQSDLEKRLYRLHVYASLHFDDDTGVPASLELTQRARTLATRVGEAASFIDPEILAAGRPRIEAFIAADAGLRPYAHVLDDVLRKAEHTLDARSEALIAAFGLVADTPSTTYTILTNADLPWPTVRLADGTEVRIDASGYARYRELPDRDDRRKVMNAFFGALKAFERTTGVTYYGQLKQDAVRARVRHYPDSLGAALDGPRLPRAVYDQLVAQTNATLPTLHRYFRLRARMLGVPQLRYYDIYPPLVQGARRFTLAEAKAHMLGAAAPLGEDYVAALRRGVQARWMDAYPRERKRSGAYMNGSVYDVHPFLLLNFNGDYASVSTLAHEWGHARHSLLANASQPFVTAHYATFTAEIASTVNEALLLDYMLQRANTDDERLLYLGSALEGLRATFYRQAMFAEFEREVHARADRGEPLSGEAFTRIYRDLLRRYHGDAVAIDDLYGVEWSYIPHFYRGFYVFQYATSIAAASLFAERILAGEPGARERYLTMLRAGGSDYPYELVKRAGVDLAQPAPYAALARRMDAIMDRIEAILATRH